MLKYVTFPALYCLMCNKADNIDLKTFWRILCSVYVLKTTRRHHQSSINFRTNEIQIAFCAPVWEPVLYVCSKPGQYNGRG